MDRQKLEKWIARQSGVEQIRVRHVSALGKTDAEVLIVEMIGEDGKSAETAAELIDEATRDDASGIGGLQAYVIIAMAGEKSIARLPVRVEGESDDVETSLSTEPANKTGLLAQLMRHNEALGRSLVMHQDAMFRSMARVISQVSEQNEHMRTKHMEQVEVTENLLSEQHERELKASESQARIEQISAMAKTVQQYLPIVVSKFMSNKAGAAPAGSNEEAISALRDSLMADPERMQKIASCLTDEEQAALIKIISPAQQGD